MAHGEGEGSGAGAPPVTPPDGGGPGSAGPTRLGDEPARDERGGGRRGVKERASRLRALLAVVAVLLVAVSLAIAMRARTTITIDISEGSPGTPAANKGALSEWADGVAGGWGDVADSSAGAGTDGLTSTSETAPAASVETSPGTHIETTSATLSESPPGTSAAANLALAGAASWRKASAHDGGPIPPLDPDLAAKLRTEPPTRDVIDLAVRLGRVQEDVPREPVQTADYVVGDRETFWVHDIQGERYFQIEAVLEYVGDNAYFWSQDGLSLSRESLERGGQTFSDSVIPAVRDFILGQDAADGVRVHVLHHESIPGVAGYFSSADELPVEVEPYSNEREMFYINALSYRPGSFPYLSLLAHEYQHMLHQSVDADEPVWVNEGLSDLSATIAGYQGQRGTPYFSWPDTGLTEWELATGSNSEHYAASYAFFSYLDGQYGDEAITSIVAQPTNGAAGIEDGLRALGVERSFDDLFLDWAVANLIHNSGRADPRYDYTTGLFDWVAPDPLPPEGVDGFVHQYATDYYDVTGSVVDGQLDLSFVGDAAIGLLGDLGASGAESGSVWWSNTGDGADSRLTRTFDLTGVDAAELSFRARYALEQNWDYAYFMASTDGGESWALLATDRTTGENPNGNNLGHGLTGNSWGWVDETLDLTPFAGGPVTVRFEMVTDDAISLAGLALDDIRLDATGFADNGDAVTSGAVAAGDESSGAADDGWLAEGWVRIDPALPQRWALQVIIDTPTGIEVRRVPVAADGPARITLDDVPGDATITLAISAMTPATRTEAAYRVERGP